MSLSAVEMAVTLATVAMMLKLLTIAALAHTDGYFTLVIAIDGVT